VLIDGRRRCGPVATEVVCIEIVMRAAADVPTFGATSRDVIRLHWGGKNSPTKRHLNHMEMRRCDANALRGERDNEEDLHNELTESPSSHRGTPVLYILVKHGRLLTNISNIPGIADREISKGRPI